MPLTHHNRLLPRASLDAQGTMRICAGHALPLLLGCHILDLLPSPISRHKRPLRPCHFNASCQAIAERRLLQELAAMMAAEEGEQAAGAMSVQPAQVEAQAAMS